MISEKRQLSEATFVLGVEAAIEAARASGFFASIRFTVLADLMQIQCLQSNDTALLRFTLPQGIKDIVDDISKSNGAKLTLIRQSKKEHLVIEFLSEDEQDKFIKMFENMSFQGKRAYPPPDIYLGTPNPDFEFCSELLNFLNRLTVDDFGRRSSSHDKQKDVTITNVQCGAIFYHAKIDEFSSAPEFKELKQPTRCYLVEYSNEFSKFFWSKPNQYGKDANFISKAMVENQPGHAVRYFNDAYTDQYVYTVTLTLTDQILFDGRAFMYKQEFSDWIGAFMGNVNPIDMKNIDQLVPAEWLQIFIENSPQE